MLVRRRSEILEYLNLHHSATLDELCSRFGVSINTIRRDIDELEKQRLLKKVYGGVVIEEKKQVIPFSIREKELLAEKDEIAKSAAALVKDNNVIVIDSGSTTIHMVKHLKQNNITLITNSINVLNEAVHYENIKVILTGGTLQRETNSLVGKEVIDTLSKFNADIAFIASTGVSISRGITNSSIPEADIKSAILNSSNNKVLLIDHTKFEKVSLVSFAGLNEVNVIITDKPTSKEYDQYFEKNSIKLIVAKEE